MSNGTGLRRRKGSTAGNKGTTTSSTHHTNDTAPYGHRDDDDAGLDKPLIQHNNYVDSDEERERQHKTNNNSAAGDNGRGSLRTQNNGPWNRLSCVSFMLNNATAAANHGTVYHKAVDVACAVIDKLPDFFAKKLGPKEPENPHRLFVDKFREYFVVTYNKHDTVHVEMVQELYRHFYATCCADTDPLVDTAGYLNFSHPTPEVLAEFNKDIISSEFWKLMGFQGTNPGTDFRGGGCLSLLLLLHLFKNRPDLVRSIFINRETAPHIAPPPRQSSASSPPEADYHRAPPFFVSEMEAFISSSNSQSTSNPAGGNLFHTCDYPFAIAAINVAMHLMLLLGVERNTTCLSTTENIASYSARLAKQKVVSIVFNDNGNCKAHEEPPHSCRPFLNRLSKEAEGAHSQAVSSGTNSTASSASSPIRLADGFDHLAALFETCIAIMHNEWLAIPPRERNILYFNQLLQKARAKTELLLRHAENILEFNKEVESYDWITH